MSTKGELLKIGGMAARFIPVVGPFIGAGLSVAGSAVDKDESDGSFKHGGKVKKTGIYKLHKGERVMTAKQSKSHPCLDC